MPALSNFPRFALSRTQASIYLPSSQEVFDDLRLKVIQSRKRCEKDLKWTGIESTSEGIGVRTTLGLMSRL